MKDPLEALSPRLGRFGAVAALSALLLVAPPAAAAHDGPHPSTREERVYFHCSGSPSKIESVNHLAPEGDRPSWDTTPPSGSIADGEGCYSAVVGGLQSGTGETDNNSQVYRGTFVGNIRDLTFEINRVGEQASVFLTLGLWVDDVPYWNTYSPTTAVAPDHTEWSDKVVVSIPDLGCSREIVDSQGNVIDVVTDGLVSEEGEGSEEHDVLLVVREALTGYAGVWGFDSIEMPSGITFNPSGELAGTVIPPAEPANCGA